MLKVLVVEDDFMLADFAEEILVERGYEVSGIASTVAEAVALARHTRPDLVMLDLRLADGLLKAHNGDLLRTTPTPVRIRLALQDLGPTFIKLGQALSTRPDVVGVAIAAELQTLQDQAPADPPAAVRAMPHTS